MIKGQIGREAVMSGVSIEYIGRPSKHIGRRNIQEGIENPLTNYSICAIVVLQNRKGEISHDHSYFRRCFLGGM